MSEKVRLDFGAEPLSPNAKTYQIKLADSEASSTLSSELQRYCNGDSSGRSFLIAGHRGSGKTTLVHKAVQEAIKSYENQALQRRPFLVNLHGPDLLNSLDNVSTGKPSEIANNDEMKSKVVKEAINELHKTLISCFKEAFWEAEDNDGLPPHLAVHFIHLLSGHPDLNALEKLWQRAGFAEKGLFNAGFYSERQGLLEILALHTSCKAFQRISGKYEVTHKFNKGEERRAEQVKGLGLPGVSDWKQITPIITAGLLGGGALLGKEGPFIAAFMATIGLLGTMATLRLTSKRSSVTSSTVESVFLPDLSNANLHRAFLDLLEKLYDAGFTPVFMIDELDKVENIGEKMRILISHFKKLVSEQAFFCFLTDRDYLEHIRTKQRREAYPEEHTYFSHVLPIYFEPEHLRKYVAEVYSFSTVYEDIQMHERKPPTDLVLMPYVLTGRSYMHPGDLRRAMISASDHEGNIDISVERYAQSPGVHEAILQLSMELVLEDETLAGQMRQRHDFRSVVYDALYYLGRQWHKGEDHVILTKDKLDEYLKGRVKPIVSYPVSEANSKGTANDQTVSLSREVSLTGEKLNKRNELYLTENELELLYQSVLKQAKFLMAPSEIVHALKASDQLNTTSLDILQSILANENVVKLLEDDDEEGKYRWRYNTYGQPVGRLEEGPAGMGLDVEVELETEWQRQWQFIQSVDTFLRDTVGYGLSHFQLRNVFPRIPGFKAVEKAEIQLRESSTPDEETNQRATLQDFVTTLNDYGEVIASVISAGAYCGRMDSGASALRRGVSTLANHWPFSANQVQDLEKLRGLHSQMGINASPPKELTAANFATWKDSVLAAIAVDPFSEDEKVTMRDDMWADWKSFLEIGSNQAQKSPTPNDLCFIAAKLPPHGLLRHRLSEMTVQAWSKVVYTGLMDIKGNKELPNWLAKEALKRLSLLSLSFDDPNLGFDHAILIITKNRGSVLADLPLSMKTRGIILTEGMIGAFKLAYPKIVNLYWPCCVIEEGIDITSVNARITLTLAKRVERGSNLQYVINPKSLDAIKAVADRALALEQERAKIARHNKGVKRIMSKSEQPESEHEELLTEVASKLKGIPGYVSMSLIPASNNGPPTLRIFKDPGTDEKQIYHILDKYDVARDLNVDLYSI